MTPRMLLVDVRWTAPNGVPCWVRQVVGGALCGYVEVPEDWQADQPLVVHGGVNFGFDRWIGFDVAHGNDYVPERDACLPEDLQGYGRRWTVEDVRAETERLAAQVPAPSPWVWTTACLALYGPDGCDATLAIVRTPRTCRVAWTHRPKKCAYQYVPNVATGAEALATRGLPPVPRWLLERATREWA